MGIRVLSSGKKKKKKKGRDSESEMEEQEEPEELEIGMAVEAQYGGKSKWYKATVMKVNKSSFGGPSRWTYDLKYEDGDREQRVKRSLIRVPSSGKKKKKKKGRDSESEVEDDEEEPEELEIGMAVEAQYGGKSKWYKATVMKVNKSRFGGADRWTYDLKYEDGDREQRVKRSLIRVLSSGKKKKKKKDRDSES